MPGCCVAPPLVARRTQGTPRSSGGCACLRPFCEALRPGVSGLHGERMDLLLHLASSSPSIRSCHEPNLEWATRAVQLRPRGLPRHRRLRIGPSQPRRISFFLCLAAGLAAAGLAGFLLSIPALRLQGDYFGIATLGFGEILRLVFQNEVWLTKGPMGLPAFRSRRCWGSGSKASRNTWAWRWSRRF
jgi:hypothetical protein